MDKWMSFVFFGEDNWESVKEKVNKENMKDLFDRAKGVATSPKATFVGVATICWFFPGWVPATIIVSTFAALYHTAGARKEDFDKEQVDKVLEENHHALASIVGAWTGSLLKMNQFKKVFIPAAVLGLVLAHLREATWGDGDYVVDAYLPEDEEE